jgi:membrane protease YdiL (CAAX protease family)
MTGRFGEIKAPLVVWLFFTLYLAAYLFVRRVFQIYTTLTLLSLLVEAAEVYGVLLAFLVVFVALNEKQRSLRDILSSMGFKRKGITKSILWSFALFPLFIIIGLVSMMLSNYLSSLSSSGAFVSSNGRFPLWYSYYMIIYALFPVAVVEEMFARGYVLDRLMPNHPSSLTKALHAIFLSSLLFTVWHLPTYLAGHGFSLLQVSVLLVGNVFPISVMLSIAYVRSKSRNIAGPVLVHFLLDAIPVIITII